MAPIRARLLIFASALIIAALAALPARAENYARIVSLYPGSSSAYRRTTTRGFFPAFRASR